MYKLQFLTTLILVFFTVHCSNAQDTIPEENELGTSYLTLSFTDCIKKTDAVGEIFQNKIEEIETIARKNDFKKFNIIAKSMNISKTEKAYG
ncbi:hypothetical protein [Marixanthomonas spongiae]|uniref:Uncharacterized protein n=1 Tax=Marixanthomonas spongiae TaxID=2174845 RepID=A0A2U0HS68_9FLAO|nr:hypothetical protein [Marixanthomonas spongiae]PVW11721.1 hypothetical protein DDV96_15600 [Marixanthomonas spongiae]